MKRRDFLKALIALPIASFFYPLPFSDKSIHKSRTYILLDSVVAGFRYYEGEHIWSRLSHGDPLQLVREPDNAYDAQAVEIYYGTEKLGYVPQEENHLVSQMLDRGEDLKARVSWLNESEDPWERVGFRVEIEV